MTMRAAVDSFLKWSILIGAIPLLFFVAGWWGSATIVLAFTATKPEWPIAACAFAGLAAGLALVAWRRRAWSSAFFACRIRGPVILYLLLAVVALGFFMGLPLGVLALGVFAGLYAGRREFHAGDGESAARRFIFRTALFTAAVTGILSLAMGLLALCLDTHTLRHVLSLAGLDWLGARAAGRIAVATRAIPALAGVQFWLTKKTALWGYSLHDASA